MKKLTREERKRKSKRRLMILTYLCFLALFLIWFFGFMVMTVDASKKERPEHTRATMPEITVQVLEDYENKLIEEALLARSHKIEDVTITFYCCEARPIFAEPAMESPPADGG